MCASVNPIWIMKLEFLLLLDRVFLLFLFCWTVTRGPGRGTNCESRCLPPSAGRYGYGYGYIALRLTLYTSTPLRPTTRRSRKEERLTRAQCNRLQRYSYTFLGPGPGLGQARTFVEGVLARHRHTASGRTIAGM
jgi:hypothetical protein